MINGESREKHFVLWFVYATFVVSMISAARIGAMRVEIASIACVVIGCLCLVWAVTPTIDSEPDDAADDDDDLDGPTTNGSAA